MDNPPEKTANFRKFILPLYLLASGFFGLYFILISWFFSGTVRSFLEFILPASIAILLAGYFPVICGFGFFLLSFTGVLLIFREMQVQSFPGKNAYPLLLIFLVITGSVILSVFLPVAEIQKILGLLYIVGFASVPLGISYLLGGLKQSGSDPSGIGKIQSFCTVVGLFGLLIAFLLLYSTLSYVPPVDDGKWHSRMWAFDPLGLLELLLGFIYLTFLMPALGILIIRLGLKFRKIPVVISEPLSETGIQPAKDTHKTGTRTPFHLTLKMKWALLILAILAVLVVGYFSYILIFNTTPGKDWTQVTTSAPFGSKGGFTSAEYKGKLWLIGGTGNAGSDGEAWETSNGITWTYESSPDMVPQRMGASSAVFKDALWVIGGMTERTLTPNNDIWFSGNGVNWSQIELAAAFSPRSGHSTVVFGDRIWVIGGNLGSTTFNLTNDIWYSDDGISWQQATPSAEFSPRFGHSTFVYHGKLWVIGGWDETGYLNDVWSSDDGIHWTQATASAAFARGSPVNAVVFDDRMWVIQNFYVTDQGRPGIMGRSQGIWYSIDGTTWSKLVSSPEFFREEYSGGPPLPIVFDNRLWVLQWHNTDTGIWFTMPEGQTTYPPIASSSPDVLSGWGSASPSSGKNWKKASDTLPFGARDGYSITVWNDAMWFIGGSKLGGTPLYSDVWYSRDGSSWTEATPGAEFGTRFRHSTAVFNEKLWLIGGYTEEVNQSGEHVYTLKNDTWYSTDGKTWTQGTPAAEFLPQEYHASLEFDNRLFVVGQIQNPTREYMPDVQVWYSPDGIHWNQSDPWHVVFFTKITPVVKDNRLWVLSGDRNLWNSPDGNTRILATVPPCNWEEYSSYTSSLAVSHNKLWLFRALEKRAEGTTIHGSMHGELWSSDDGINWVLVTDSVPFAEGSRALNDFHLVTYDNKIWAYMLRGTSKPFSDGMDWTTEIWYTEME